MLAVMSAAVAMIMLLVSTVLSQGTVAWVAGAERAFLGGDILVLPQVLAVPGMHPRADAQWRWTSWSWDEPGPLAFFMPWIFTQGAVVQPGGSAQPESAAQPGGAPLKALEAEIARQANVRAIYPYYAMPALWTVNGRTVRVWLHARVPELDAASGWNRYLSAGRPLSAAADFTALVDGYRHRLESDAAKAYGYDRYNGRWLVAPDGDPTIVDWPVPPLGSDIRLQVPRAGTAGFDFTRLEDVTLTVRGLYQLEDGIYDWTTHGVTNQGYTPGIYRDLKCSPCMWTKEPAVWSTTNIEVSLATLRAVAAKVGAHLEPQALLVQVKDPASLHRTVDALRDALPATVLSVPEMAQEHALDFIPSVATPHDDLSLLHRVGMDPPPLDAPPPAWMRSTLLGLGLAMTALLFFANVFVLLYTRQKEFATFRVLGARRSQLLSLVAAEVFAVSFAGAVLGGLVMLPMTSYQVGTAHGWTAVFTQLAYVMELGFVVSLASATAGVLFGVIVVRRSPWGVLKSD